MKEKIIAIIMSSIFAVPVFAQNISSDHFSQQVFSSQNTHQVAELSHSEMKDTKGRFGPWGAALGGIGSGAGYVIQHQISGEPMKWGDFATRVGIGATLGAVSPTPTAVIWGFNGKIAYGIGKGIYDHYHDQPHNIHH